MEEARNKRLIALEKLNSKISEETELLERVLALCEEVDQALSCSTKNPVYLDQFQKD